MVNRFFFIILLSFGFYFSALAQTSNPDSLAKVPFPSSFWNIHGWITDNAPETKTGVPFVKQNNEWHFFVAVIILALFAAFKVVFPKYAQDLFNMVKKSAIRSKHIKDQLKGDLLASILLDLFFCIVAGTFIYIIVNANNGMPNYNRTIILFICIIGILLIYLIKYISLQFFGWVFQVKEAVSNYIFTVFFFNKIIGILLLPIVVFLLINNKFTQPVVTITLFLISILLLYRYFLSYISVAKSLQMNKFHFFLYLCSVEVAPLLLIYKSLLINFKGII